jgi:hypothetical protein
MAQSVTQPNNRAVKFRGHKEREMAKTKMPGQVDPKMPKGSMKTPKTVVKAAAKPARARQRQRQAFRKAAKRGLISDEQMKNFMGER